MGNPNNWPQSLSGVILLFIINIFTAHLLWSEDTEEPDIEIVVTADRVEKATTRIPALVTVITAEEIKTRGKETIPESLAELGGLNFRSTTGNPAQAEIAMRGFGENSHGRVLVLLNGVKLNRPDMAGINWLQIPIENIERIEVVHGGGSTLYGDHAVGGVINIITKKGSPNIMLDAFAAGGSYYHNQERMGITGPIGPFSLALNAEHTATEGYREHSGFETLGAGLSLGLGDPDVFQSSLSLSYEWLDYDLPGYLTETQMEEDPTQSLPANTPGETENQHLNSLFHTQVALAEWGRMEADVFYNIKLLQDDIPGWSSYTNKYLHSLGACPRLSSDFTLFNRPNNITIGTDLAWDVFDFNRYTSAGRNTKDLDVLVTKGSAGVYLNDEFSLLDTLHIRGGLRYELARIAASASLGTDVEGEKIHQVLIGNAGIAWEFIPLSKLYGRFEMLYRYPFIDEQVSYYGFGADEVYEDLEAERGYNVEAGGELVLWERLLALRFNLFYLMMEDEIAWNSATFRNENLAKTLHTGVEAGADFKIGDLLQISGNYTYTYAVFMAGENKGKYLPLVPEHNAFIELIMNLPLGFSLGSSFTYRGTCYVGQDFSNTQEELADYFLWNGFLKYVPDYIPGKLQIILGLENILNVHYVTSAYYDGSIIGYYPEPGFNWKISVSYGVEL